MRTTARAMVAAFSMVTIGLTGCSGDDNGSPGSGTSTAPSTPKSASASASAASCVIGTWRGSGLSGKLNASGVTGTIDGGGGFTMTVAPDGKTNINFDGMQPINFALAVAGGQVKGSFQYGGNVNGAVKTPSGDTGTWEPTGTTDWSTLTVTVDLTQPTRARLADKVSIADFANKGSANTGGAVETQPILRSGTYKCGGNTLEIGPPSGNTSAGTWTFTKA